MKGANMKYTPRIFCFSLALCLTLAAQLLSAGETGDAPQEEQSILPIIMPALMQKTTYFDQYPPAGNPEGKCEIPPDGQEEDTGNPDHVIGDGTPQSCTSEAVVNTIAKGGVIRFNCGPAPLTIKLNKTAKIENTTGPRIVIDGGGKIALSGQNQRRILYMNTCDKNQTWTTPHCNDQDHPQLTVQNLIFIGGNSSKEHTYDGGGAIWARGGRLKIVNCRFFSNTCAATGPDVGGAAVRAFDQYSDLPLYVVNSTFGGSDELGNSCSNGGGLSSIGVSYSVYNSLFSHNEATGYGANPQRSGSPGGGSGGAIYNDGNTFTLYLCGTKIEKNTIREGGSAIFFVSNDRSGTLRIEDSHITGNTGDRFDNYPGIFFLGRNKPQFINSIIE